MTKLPRRPNRPPTLGARLPDPVIAPPHGAAGRTRPSDERLPSGAGPDSMSGRRLKSGAGPDGAPGRRLASRAGAEAASGHRVPSGAGPEGASGHRAHDRGDLPGVPMTVAIAAALAAPGVDAVTRVHLDEARASLAAARTDAADPLETPTLSQALFHFVMPRLQHPEVLAVEHQVAMLHEIAQELGGPDGDTVVREGALAVHRELRRLTLLRQRCNSLVAG